MKQSFRLYRENGVYYCQDMPRASRRACTPMTSRRRGILHAKNEAGQMGTLNLQIARAYMVASDPLMPERTWRDVIRSIIEEKTGPTRDTLGEHGKGQGPGRSLECPGRANTGRSAVKDAQAWHVSTNVFLRRLHNHALAMNWLAWGILARKQWPKVVYGEKRGITLEEHHQIHRAGEKPERRDYTNCCLGFWEAPRRMSHRCMPRMLLEGPARCFIAGRKNAGMRSSASGIKRQPFWRGGRSRSAFPVSDHDREKYRATEFKQRCRGLGIEGVTLHSYRYGWAERARHLWLSERHAQSGLGHGSKAVARAYAKKRRR